MSKGARHKRKERSRREPGCCVPGQREGGAGPSLASQDARKRRGVCPIPQPAFPSPSLSPPPRPPAGYSLLPRDAASRNRLFFLLFWIWLLAGGAEEPRTLEKNAGSGLRPPPTGEIPQGRAEDGRTDGRTDGRPHHQLSKLTLQTPVECVRARERGRRGSTSSAPGPVTKGITFGRGSLDSDQGHLQAQKLLRN